MNVAHVRLQVPPRVAEQRALRTRKRLDLLAQVVLALVLRQTLASRRYKIADGADLLVADSSVGG